MTDDSLLVLRGLVVEFRSREVPGQTNLLRAVDDVSFTVRRGETVGLVGESGSGKSTVARALVGLERAKSGNAYFMGQDLFQISIKEFRRIRRHIQMVFQDPFSSLNQRMTVEQTLIEPLKVHGLAQGRRDMRERLRRLFSLVELDESLANKRPRELSGGQRQRVAIARALAVEPSLLICDEPVSALDVSIQAQILNLFRDLQEQIGVSLVFISHDLNVVRHVSDRVIVLHRGRVMESGPITAVYGRPCHPYTMALLASGSGPVGTSRTGPSTSLAPVNVRDNSPQAQDPSESCYLSDRCAFSESVCFLKKPQLEDVDDSHVVACHRWKEIFWTDEA